MALGIRYDSKLDPLLEAYDLIKDEFTTDEKEIVTIWLTSWLMLKFKSEVQIRKEKCL